MSQSSLCELKKKGQSVWLDFITREFVHSGKFAKLVREDCVSGVTINPTIFDEALSSGKAYDDDIKKMKIQGYGPEEIYHRLIVADVVDSCTVLRPVHLKTEGYDGFVSVEVSPEYARDPENTMREARELVAETGSLPNVMVKVPGTPEGIEPIRKLTAEGYNVNVTLLFSARQYKEAAEAYMAGLEERMEKGQTLHDAVSVASVFVSRIDTMVDKRIDSQVVEGHPEAPMLEGLRGKLGIATAKLCTATYLKLLDTDRWKRLAECGARPQRLLFGSTSAKDPAYSDVKYIEELIGPATVSTMPLKTLEAFRDHGKVDLTLLDGLLEAKSAYNELVMYGFDLDEVYETLQVEAIEKFQASFDHIFDVLGDKFRGISAA